MREAAVVGLGQLGRLFGGAALACGYRTTPILRGAPIAADLEGASRGPVVVAVGEAALPEVLAQLPPERRGDVVLVQNELFPDVWRAPLGDAQPTVAVVWSNVKKGRPVEVGRATHVFGPYAQFVRELHGVMGIPCAELKSPLELEQELVAKYAFILGINALGLAQARTIGEWLDADAPRVDAVLAQAVALGAARVGRPQPGAHAIARAAMATLRAMPAAGRTARERVERAREMALRLGVPLAL